MGRSLVLISTVPLLLALTTAGGCGDDEAPEAQWAPMPDAGSEPSDGGDGPGPDGPRANFGRACETTQDCGLNLLCLTADSRSLSRGGPPRGLCTASCDSDPELCAEYGSDARCVQFGQRSYCMQGCAYGSSVESAFDREKCHGRIEFACKPMLVNTRVSCKDDSDCDGDARCIEDSCWVDVPTCMPQCNNGADCDSGLFCDPRSGECVPEVSGGDNLGERCDPEQAPDPCRGSCGLLQSAEGAYCDETCTLGAFPACGQDANLATFGCAIPVSRRAAYGDMGYCARLCDCTADCPEGLQCVVSELPYLQRPGFCATPDPGDGVRSSCASAASGGATGSGGSGGFASGGTTSAGGSGGTLGQAGAAGATSEGGAAGAPEMSRLTRW